MTIIQNKILKNFIYIIILLLPSYLIRFELFNIPFTALEVLILALFILFLAANNFKFNLYSYKYVILSFIAIGIIATIFSENNIAALGMLKAYIIEPVLFFIVFINVKPKLSKVLSALGLSAIFVSIVGIMQYFTGFGIPEPWNQATDYRITSVYNYPNAVGLYLAPIIAMFTACLIKVRKKIKLSLTVIIFSLFAIFAAVTQGAWLAVLLSFIFVGCFTKYKKIFITGILLGVIIMFAVTSMREAVTFQDTSGDVRLALWQGTANLLQDRPLIGSGLGDFPSVYQEYKLDKHVELLLYPHNIFLNFWTQLGLLGLLWLLFVIFKFYKIGFKHKQKKAVIISMAAMTAILVYGLVDVPYFKNDLAVLFWIVLGLMEVKRISVHP